MAVNPGLGAGRPALRWEEPEGATEETPEGASEDGWTGPERLQLGAWQVVSGELGSDLRADIGGGLGECLYVGPRDHFPGRLAVTVII